MNNFICKETIAKLFIQVDLDEASRLELARRLLSNLTVGCRLFFEARVYEILVKNYSISVLQVDDGTVEHLICEKCCSEYLDVQTVIFQILERILCESTISTLYRADRIEEQLFAYTAFKKYAEQNARP